MNLFINQQELDNCVLEQLLNLKEFEERFVELMMRLFETESCLFLFGFKRELETHNQLIEMESLYDFLTDLEEIYLKCVEIFNKNFSKFESEQVKEIVVGIIETLKSSLEMFPRESDNMIAYERITMVSEAITQLKGMIRESIATYMSQHLSTTFSDFDMKNMIEALLNHILRDHLTQMRDLHGWSLKEINVYDHRVQGKKYMNFVSSAKKMLTAYQSIRVDIVESQIQAGAEIETLKQILMIIAEIYKRLDGKEKQMFEMVNKSGFTMETIKKSFDTLMDYKPILERMEENEELLDCFNDFASKKQDIVQKLSVSITDEIKKAIMFSMQEFVEASKEFQLLSCMAVQHLKFAQQQIEEIDLVNAVLPGELKKALTALKETMSMKYLTLKEKEFDYTL
ncbi:MAG: hypothetical protein H7X94_00750, partial [Vallitaleaceae bacterium]|nr:hypothetical protein [Vallitaleaceae bacterium]